ncbi:MAG: polysaccharide deacetylase family protein [Spirochaetes bacterium]|nr:polysaccharide deacetylase family protein [Spirochaetota bacterium]
MRVYTNLFPEGKRKALTLSYDDGKIADRKLVEIMDRYGLRGAFHLNSAFLGDATHITKEELPSLFKNHEVSVHTATHPHLIWSPMAQIVKEITDDRTALEAVMGFPIRGMSYPFGTYDSRVIAVLPSLGIEYARTTASHQNFHMPENFLAWHPTCHHKADVMALADRFIAEDPRDRMMLFYFWGHSYEFDNDRNWDVIERFGERIGKRSDIWYATNIEIVDYVNAQRALRFSADCTMVHNPSATTVWILAKGAPVAIAGGTAVTIG